MKVREHQGSQLVWRVFGRGAGDAAPGWKAECADVAEQPGKFWDSLLTQKAELSLSDSQLIICKIDSRTARAPSTPGLDSLALTSTIYCESCRQQEPKEGNADFLTSFPFLLNALTETQTSPC